MKPKIVEQPEFSIIGIQVRTSNAKETTGQGDIPKQWSKFYKEGIADKIPNKLDSTIYAVYTNYASDYNGAYDFIIGMKVERHIGRSAGDGCEENSKRQICNYYQRERDRLSKLFRKLGSGCTAWMLANSLLALALTKVISRCTTSAA